VCRGGQTGYHSVHELLLLIKLSVALVRNNMCSLKMIELSKRVGAD
jgi:hypothetical protein